MARIPLFPRLQPAGVDHLLEQAGSDGPPEPRNCNEALADIEMISFAASGGGRDLHFVDTLADGIRGRAERHGFPAEASQSQRAKFDQDVAILLGMQWKLQTGEGLRNDVWAFLATVMMPDVVAWRFPDQAAERFHGGVRNALQRLWIRGYALDRGEGHSERWLYLRELTEDSMVQIFERASLSSEPQLAQAIAANWVQTAETIGRNTMESVMRSAIKLIRLRNEIVDLGGVPEHECRHQVDELFVQAVEMVRSDSY